MKKVIAVVLVFVILLSCVCVSAFATSTKISESLALITPEMIDKMKSYQKKKQTESIKLAHAMQQETKEYIVPIKENKEKKKIDYDPDDWLD